MRNRKILSAAVMLLAGIGWSWNPPAMEAEPVVTGIGWTEVNGEWVPQLDVQLRMPVGQLWTVGVQVAPVLSDPAWKAGSIDLKRYGAVLSARYGLGGLVIEAPIEVSAINASYLIPTKDENDKPVIDERGGWGFSLSVGAVLAFPLSEGVSIGLEGGYRRAWVWVKGVDEDLFSGPQVALQFRWLP